jgi:hypothetical protein
MKDELERILDEGIAGYAKSEPLAGLAERILARIRTAEQPQWRWSFAIGLAVIAVGVVVIIGLPRREELPAVRAVASVPMPKPAMLAEAKAVRVVTKRRHGIGHITELPKLAVFPTPSPLTSEERLLVALVKRDPQGAAEAFESLRKRNGPIEIAPLAIPPLESPTEQ